MVVDYFLRGRQFGRFLANHTDAHERYGFTDQDIRWISRYCPETGANDNEVEYEEKCSHSRGHNTHQPPMPYRASMSSRSRRQASGGEEFDRRNSSFSHGSRLYRPVEDGSRPHKKDSARKTIIQSFVCFFCFSPSG
ncbi:unnamed protein product [Fusarium graminearum]|nr:unnamed protein product [Fusarium graminearum]